MEEPSAPYQLASRLPCSVHRAAPSPPTSMYASVRSQRSSSSASGSTSRDPRSSTDATSSASHSSDGIINTNGKQRRREAYVETVADHNSQYHESPAVDDDVFHYLDSRSADHHDPSQPAYPYCHPQHASQPATSMYGYQQPPAASGQPHPYAAPYYATSQRPSYGPGLNHHAGTPQDVYPQSVYSHSQASRYIPAPAPQQQWSDPEVVRSLGSGHSGNARNPKYNRNRSVPAPAASHRSMADATFPRPDPAQDTPEAIARYLAKQPRQEYREHAPIPGKAEKYGPSIPSRELRPHRSPRPEDYPAPTRSETAGRSKRAYQNYERLVLQSRNGGGAIHSDAIAHLKYASPGSPEHGSRTQRSRRDSYTVPSTASRGHTRQRRSQSEPGHVRGHRSALDGLLKSDGLKALAPMLPSLLKALGGRGGSRDRGRDRSRHAYSNDGHGSRRTQTHIGHRRQPIFPDDPRMIGQPAIHALVLAAWDEERELQAKSTRRGGRSRSRPSSYADRRGSSHTEPSYSRSSTSGYPRANYGESASGLRPDFLEAIRRGAGQSGSRQFASGANGHKAEFSIRRDSGYEGSVHSSKRR